jgi:hypothetical protein
MAPVEPQQDTSLPSLGEIVEQILRTREPPPTILDLARAPPERRRREGFFRPRTLPRIRIPGTECFGDRSLRREQQNDPGPKESTSSESAYNSIRAMRRAACRKEKDQATAAPPIRPARGQLEAVLRLPTKTKDQDAMNVVNGISSHALIP